MWRRTDFLERTSRILTLTALAIAIVAAIAAPLLAISWSHQPFPGFLMEETLVVNEMGGSNWPGRARGIDYPQRLTRLGGRPVTTEAEYDAVASSLSVGQAVSIFTLSPDGRSRLFPAVQLITFPVADLIRLFWVPYLVGLAYAAIGLWIYQVKGMSRPGRALAFFCFAASLSCTLFFDAASSHVVSALWLAALALLGGTLISLGLRFPVESQPVAQRPWLLAVPYGVSIFLAGWGFVALHAADPWAYIPNRYAVYLFTVIAAVFFLAMMVLRARRIESPTVRRQARIVLLGSVLAFAPIAIWFLGTISGPWFTLDVALFLPPLIIFPISVAIAIFRYRLLEVDNLVNRAVLYGAVTAILAGVISVSISLTQRFFLNVTGEKSDIAVIITTLIVVSAFEPIKTRVRAFVDKHLKEAPDKTEELQKFGAEVRSFVEVTEPYQIVWRLLEAAARGLQAQSGVLSLISNGELQPLCTVGRWNGEAWMAVPLEWAGERYGVLALGPRQDGTRYTRRECEVLEQVAHQVAGAVYVSWTFHRSENP
jgi:hypothetical protein